MTHIVASLGWRPVVAKRGALAAAILGTLAACSSVSLTDPEPSRARAPAASTPGPERADSLSAAPGMALQRGRSRWVPVRWSDLPGWDADRSAELWPALLRGCERPAAGWAALCAQARSAGIELLSDAATRAWLAQRLQPFRVETDEGASEGLITGYFEPLVEASRTPRPGFQVPLHSPPADLATRRPY